MCLDGNLIEQKLSNDFVLFNLIDDKTDKPLTEAIEAKFQNCFPGCELPRKFIPIFICSDFISIRRNGFFIPYEFVFQTSRILNHDYYDLPEKEPEYLCDIIGDSLYNRIDLLQSIDKGRVTLKDVKDWCVGAFRKFLLLDENVHGTSGTLNINELKNDTNKFCEKYFGCIADAKADSPKKILANRFKDNGEKLPFNDPFCPYIGVLKALFNEEYKLVSGFIGNGCSAKKNIKNFFLKPKNDGKHLPTQEGLAIKFVSPRDISILIVDDNEEKKNELEKFFKNSLGPVFNFKNLNISRNNCKSDTVFFQNIIDKISEEANPFDGNNFKSYNYDCILLDLSFGESPDSDLLGYQLIKIFKRFMPAVPIIIYSEHEDMGHIERAFREGARWFLKKSEAKKKLTRHFISLLARREWEKEWKVLSTQYKFGFEQADFERKFYNKRTWQFLTLKCLENLPGHYIMIKKLGDGLSSADTFMAQKGVIKDDLTNEGKSNQPPVIIKIDSIFNTRMEYERYFRFIRPYIANVAGRVENNEIILNRDNSAIVYTFAGRIDAAHDLKTLDELLRNDLLSRDTCDYEKYRKRFDDLFDEIISRLHNVTPQTEFIDSDNTPKNKSEYSDYPNHTFGELYSEGNQNNHSWFFSNYTYRMPIETVVDKFNINLEKGEPFEVYGVYKDDPVGKKDPQYPYRWEIECKFYNDKRKDYDKYILKGDKASFYVRFRKFLKPYAIIPLDILTQKIENESMSWRFDSNTLVLTKNGIDIPQTHKFKLNLNDNIKSLVGIEFPLIGVRNVLKFLCDKQPERFKCPVGIIHGDLNLKNVMIDSRIHLAGGENHKLNKKLTDVWLIDFAKTRRDVIAHDYNIAFTSTLALLFQKDLVSKYKNEDGYLYEEQNEYLNRLNEVFEPFVRHVLFDKSDSLADSFVDDRRLVFVYKILRRIHRAAIEAGLSEDMYLLTTALSCFYSFKIYINQKMPEAAAALVITGLLCAEKLLTQDVLDEWNKEMKNI